MFFEDEKDIIREDAEIHIDEDGTVTWEDVLSQDDDDDVVLFEEDTPKAPAKKAIKASEELTSIQSDDDDDDFDDQELYQILNDSKESKPQKAKPAPKKIVQEEPEEEEDFDLDSQLASAAMDDDDNVRPQKRSKNKDTGKKNAAPSPVLIIALLGVLIAVGVFYATQYLTQNEAVAKASKAELDLPKTPQRAMNNITQEELEQRQQAAQNPPAQANNPDNTAEQEAAKTEEEQKQEEEKLEEKKQIVHVIPTGRENPFMPIAKYATSSIPDTDILYDRSGIPKPPDSYGERDEGVTNLMSIAVSGIMYDNVKPSAIITHDNNDYFVQKGDKLDEYKIVEIGKTYVMIALGKNVYKANIGEEFKIDTKEYGIADYIPKKQGGGVQYYSVTNSARKNRKEDSLRYTSEDDIQINAKY